MTPTKYSIAPGHSGPRKVSPNIRTDIGPWVSSTAGWRARYHQGMTCNLGQRAAQREAFSSYTSRVMIALFGRATIPSRSDRPYGAKTTKPSPSRRTATLDTVVGQVPMAASVDA